MKKWGRRPVMLLLGVILLVMVGCGIERDIGDVGASLTVVMETLQAQNGATDTPIPSITALPSPTSSPNWVATEAVALLFTEASVYQTANAQKYITVEPLTATIYAEQTGLALSQTLTAQPTLTQIILYVLAEGQCFDFDTGEFPANLNCDVRLAGSPTLLPLNGAKFALVGHYQPPTKDICRGDRYYTEPFAPDLGIYVCFVTNKYTYGHFVMVIDNYFIEKAIAFQWEVFE